MLLNEMFILATSNTANILTVQNSTCCYVFTILLQKKQKIIAFDQGSTEGRF